MPSTNNPKSKNKDKKSMRSRKIKPVWIALAGLLVVGGIAAYVLLHPSQQNTVTDKHVVQTGTAEIATTLSGRLLPSTSLDLRFNEAGTIQSVYKEEGEEVASGALLATLSNTVLLAERNAALAEIATQESILNELQAGSRSEDIQEKQVAYDLVILQREHALTDLVTLLQDAKSIMDNAIRNTVDDFFTNPQSANPQLDFALAKNQSLELELEFERTQIERMLTGILENSITSTDITLDTYQDLAKQTLSNLQNIRDFLTLAAFAVNSAESSSSLTDATIRTWKSNIANERTTINSTITTIQNATQTIQEKKLAVLQASSTLNRLINGTSKEDIATQQAKINRAKADLATIQAKINNRTITAPTAGLITAIFHEAGETVTGQDIIMNIIAPDAYELELEVPELNITTMKKGNPVKATFAALPDQIFEGKIVSIKEVATSDTNLVPFYDVRASIENPVPELKGGLIADIEVVTSIRPNQILIPTHFVFFDEITGDPFVWTQPRPGEQIQRQSVTLGPITRDGQRIIEDGLMEGDNIVIR